MTSPISSSLKREGEWFEESVKRQKLSEEEPMETVPNENVIHGEQLNKRIFDLLNRHPELKLESAKNILENLQKRYKAVNAELTEKRIAGVNNYILSTTQIAT